MGFSLELYLLSVIFVFFCTYCFIGWVYESTVESVMNKKLINRGFLRGPFIPIYGEGAIIAIFLLSPFEQDLPEIALFFIGGTVACILEYVVSFVLERRFGKRWWDYSSWPLNINGRVCLFGFIAFGVLIVVLLRFLHPAIADFYTSLPEWMVYLMSIVLLCWIGADTVMKLRELHRNKEEVAVDATNA